MHFGIFLYRSASEQEGVSEERTHAVQIYITRQNNQVPIRHSITDIQNIERLYHGWRFETSNLNIDLQLMQSLMKETKFRGFVQLSQRNAIKEQENVHVRLSHKRETRFPRDGSCFSERSILYRSNC